MVALVGDDEGGGVVGGALDVLPGGATLDGAAPVVAARVGGPLDRLLPVLAPRVLVGGDVRHPRARRRHAHRAPHPLLPLLGAVAPAVRVGCAVAVAVATGGAGRVRVRVGVVLALDAAGERGLPGGDKAPALRHAAVSAGGDRREERRRGHRRRRDLGRIREVQRQALHGGRRLRRHRRERRRDRRRRR